MKYIVAIVTLAAFAGVASAQQTPAPAAAPAAVAAPAKAEKPAAKKHEMAKKDVFKGEITAIDATKNTITVKGAKEEKTFTLENLTDMAQGAKVIVTTKDGKSVAKVQKEHKGEHKGKKAEKKAEAAAPAATPAPAAK
jgi:hypothetical protein